MVLEMNAGAVLAGLGVFMWGASHLIAMAGTIITIAGFMR